MSILRIPLSTYRLQFNYRFTLKEAINLVDYLHQLGISDCYASPIMKAQPGSVHGYDIVDHSQINPEVGTEGELEKFVHSLQQKGMGLVLDIVPNHMCIIALNKWWDDVLENGPSSLYANYFNIVWNPPKVELKNKILLSVLGEQYGKVIDNGELKVVYALGSFFIEYKERYFPVNPRTWPVILEPVVEKLRLECTEDDPGLLELQSIITALNHLPGMSETDPEKCIERNREKEIIKKRLFTLLEEKPGILATLQQSITALNGNKEDPHSFDKLEDLLKCQAYRLSFWRVTNEEINYRRFFDINDLASMRVEDERVFHAIHELALQWIKKGWVTGVRVDHVDGLFNPKAYLERLQLVCFEAIKNEKPTEIKTNFYSVVEKILVGQEKLHSEWLTFGTTGYDYLNEVNGVFVVAESKAHIEQIYTQFTGRNHTMADTIFECKKFILNFSMSSELHILSRHLEEVCEQHRWSRDYTLEVLRHALSEIIACFPVYRTYIDSLQTKVSEEDKRYITSAINDAKRVNPASDVSVFDFIQSVLLLEDPPGLTVEQMSHRRDFVMRFQQLTGPVTAKGVEDTAFYRYYPLASLNEVGMDPEGFGISVDLFHQKNRERLERWPHTLLATFTHDTKRSEDVRARINVLSENPEKWHLAIQRWRECNKDKKIRINRKEVPDANEEYLLYQTLVGSWPLYPMDASSHIQYRDRIEKYMNKALREAKIHTSWINVNEPYEKAVKDFIIQVLNLDSSSNFLKDLMDYIQPIMRAGMFNSLSQTLLKITSPGIPDFYQGSELWEFTLVDPDNRRPVDYSYRHELLQALKQKAEQDSGALVSHLMETPEDGRIKLYLTSQLLNFRKQRSELFTDGDYQPLKIEGEKSNHIVAFSRVKDKQSVIIATGRFYSALVKNSFLPIGQDTWKDTFICSDSIESGRYKDCLTGSEIFIEKGKPLLAAQLFSKLSQAALYKID